MRAALVVVALCLTVSLSHAEEPDVVSGNFFLPICKEAFSPTKPESALDTYGYGNCVGILDTLMMLGPHLEAQRRFCPPSGATTHDAFLVGAAYLEARPQLLNQNFVQLAAIALAKAWPCK